MAAAAAAATLLLLLLLLAPAHARAPVCPRPHASPCIVTVAGTPSTSLLLPVCLCVCVCVCVCVWWRSGGWWLWHGGRGGGELPVRHVRAGCAAATAPCGRAVWWPVGCISRACVQRVSLLMASGMDGWSLAPRVLMC